MGMQYRTSSMVKGTFYTFWFEKNLQEDIVAVYNSAGTKVISYSYDAWGNCITTHHNVSGTNSYASFNPFRYRGYYYDSELGFYYLNSRYYNPLTGRFINADALISTGHGLLGYNMFAYCNNNPIIFFDQFGKDAMLITDYSELPIFGHSVLYIQDEDGVWYRTEICGNMLEELAGIFKGDFTLTASCVFTSVNAENEVKAYKNRGFWNSIGSMFCIWGTDYIYYEGDYSNCIEVAKNSQTDNFNYRPLTNNCLTYTKNILALGDCDNKALDIYNKVAITPFPQHFHITSNYVRTIFQDNPFQECFH